MIKAEKYVIILFDLTEVCVYLSSSHSIETRLLVKSFELFYRGRIESLHVNILNYTCK